MTDFLQITLLALLGSVIALVGGIVFLFNKDLSELLEEYSIPFAAGVLITVSLLGLVPEAYELINEQTFVYVLIAFFGAFLFENFLFDIHHHQGSHDHKHNSAVPLVIFGDTIHNFIDGIAIAASYMVAPGLGLITALSTFLHEVPHEIGDFGILLKAGWKKKNVLIVNAISASFSILGAYSIFFFSENTQFVGLLLSISAGIFLYLGTIDFLPQVIKSRRSKMKSVVPLFLGVLVMIITLMAVPHGH